MWYRQGEGSHAHEAGGAPAEAAYDSHLVIEVWLG
jgi:hypothetical protein